MSTEDLKERKAERLGHGLGDTNGLSWSCNWPKLLGAQEPAVSEKEERILRELAKRVAEIAAHPKQRGKKRLWLKHNALDETLPLIFGDPENAWYELIPATQLASEGNLARLATSKKQVPRRDPDAGCPHAELEPGEHHPLDSDRAGRE